MKRWVRKTLMSTVIIGGIAIVVALSSWIILVHALAPAI